MQVTQSLVSVTSWVKSNFCVLYSSLLSLMLATFRFSEIPSSDLGPSLTPSAPIVQHPSLPDTPCYVVQILVPSPTPLPSSRGTSTPTPTLPPSSRPSTQHPTPLATPRSEPIPQTRYVTPHDAATLFLKSLHQSAIDFLGKVPDGAVITVPSWFTESHRDAVHEAAKEAGIRLVHLLEEDAAAASVVLDADNDMNQEKGGDRTALLVDWGATDLMVSLLSVRAGLVHVLASKRSPGLGMSCTGSIDEVFVKHFAKEFSKKMGEPLQVPIIFIFCRGASNDIFDHSGLSVRREFSAGTNKTCFGTSTCQTVPHLCQYGVYQQFLITTEVNTDQHRKFTRWS